MRERAHANTLERNLSTNNFFDLFLSFECFKRVVQTYSLGVLLLRRVRTNNASESI